MPLITAHLCLGCVVCCNTPDFPSLSKKIFELMFLLDKSPVCLSFTAPHHIHPKVVNYVIELFELYQAGEKAEAVELAQKQSDAVIWFNFWYITVFPILHLVLDHLVNVPASLRPLATYF